MADEIQKTSKKMVYSIISGIQSLFNINKLINLPHKTIIFLNFQWIQGKENFVNFSIYLWLLKSNSWQTKRIKSDEKNLYKTYSKHSPDGDILKAFFFRPRSVTTSIQYCTGGLCWCNKTKKNKNWQEEAKLSLFKTYLCRNHKKICKYVTRISETV